MAAATSVQEQSEISLEPGVYVHFKNNKYEVVGSARHTETNEEFIVYRRLDGDGQLWIRPKSMFFETIELNGMLVPRFRYAGSKMG